MSEGMSGILNAPLMNAEYLISCTGFHRTTDFLVERTARIGLVNKQKFGCLLNKD